MNQGRYVFTQLVEFLPRKNFEWLVKKYDGNKNVKGFSWTVVYPISPFLNGRSDILN